MHQDGEVPLEVDHVLQDDFFLLIEGLTVIVSLLGLVQVLADHNCYVVADLHPQVVVTLARLSDLLNHLNNKTIRIRLVIIS